MGRPVFGQKDNGYIFSQMSWPSTANVDISDLPGLIAGMRIKPMIFVQDDRMNAILEGAFNITPAHLNGQREYLPTRDIAQFLLRIAADPPIPVQPEGFLLNALKTHSKHLFSVLLNIASAQEQRDNWAEALLAWHNLERLQDLTGAKISGIHFRIVRCLQHMGDITKSVKRTTG